MSLEKGENKLLLRFVDYTATIVLAIVAIALVVLLMTCVFRKQQIPVEHQIVLTVSTDSLSSSVIDACVVDSINNIITQHEILLKEYYRHLLEKRDWDDSIISIGSLLVGIIISILGFFGFRSFKSIEDKAADIAADESKTVAKNKTKEYLDSHLEEIVFKKHIKTISDSVSTSLRDSIVQELHSDIDSIKEVVGNVESNSKEIETLRCKMERAITEIEKLSKKEIEIKIIESAEEERNIDSIPSNPFNEDTVV